MNATRQAVLSAIRSILIAIGSSWVTKGYVDSATVDSLIGAAMIIVPVIWGVWDKYRAERLARARETVAVNVGITAANVQGQTALLGAQEARGAIASVAPTISVPKGDSQ
ncbi:MAG: hypothetical protein HY661_07670 [Betaproteobacteria bacterium]|nr:hypothetical protein [Betaproteobacteria bacterium]